MSAARPLSVADSRRNREDAGAREVLICPACGCPADSARRAWRFVNARGERQWLACPDCHAYFMDGSYDLAAETQHTQQMTWGDAHHGALLNDFKQRMYRSILTQLKQHVEPHGRTLLDVGCAYGGFMSAARNAGFRVFGYDIVPEAVATVQKAGMMAVCCGRMIDCVLPVDTFDVVSVLDANIYWPDQPAELRAIHDRLQRGGLLVMRVVDKSWLARIGAILQAVSPARGERLLRRAVNDHRFSMPLASCLKVLERSGFRVLSASPRGAIHSDQTSLPVRLSFHIGTALWHSLGIFMAPGAVIMAERP